MLLPSMPSRWHSMGSMGSMRSPRRPPVGARPALMLDQTCRPLRPWPAWQLTAWLGQASWVVRGSWHMPSRRGSPPGASPLPPLVRGLCLYMCPCLQLLAAHVSCMLLHRLSPPTLQLCLLASPCLFHLRSHGPDALQRPEPVQQPGGQCSVQPPGWPSPRPAVCLCWPAAAAAAVAAGGRQRRPRPLGRHPTLCWPAPCRQRSWRERQRAQQRAGGGRGLASRHSERCSCGTRADFAHGHGHPGGSGHQREYGV